jgi:hypothetical protein
MSSHAKRELPTSTANYILVVDAYSKWPACVPFRTFSYSSVIAEMEGIFIDFGVPEVIMSDNGSQFDCAEFWTFCEGRAIRSVQFSQFVILVQEFGPNSFLPSPPFFAQNHLSPFRPRSRPISAQISAHINFPHSPHSFPPSRPISAQI